MSDLQTDNLLRTARVAAITIIAAVLAYLALDAYTQRRLEREIVLAQRGDSTLDSAAARDPMRLMDGATAAPAGAPSTAADGECHHESWELRHPEPVALVRDYLRLDAAGQFLEENQWLASAVSCPERLPGTEQAAVISGYRARPLGRVGDTARVEVTYQRAGSLVQRGAENSAETTLGFEPDPRSEVDTFVVVRGDSTWRIAAPVLEQHVLPTSALHRFALGDEDRKKLEAIKARN